MYRYDHNYIVMIYIYTCEYIHYIYIIHKYTVYTRAFDPYSSLRLKIMYPQSSPELLLPTKWTISSVPPRSIEVPGWIAIHLP